MNSNFNRLKSLLKKDLITSEVEKNLEKELFYLECNQEDCNYVLNVYDELTKSGTKTTNPNNSTVIYVLGLAEAKPKAGITKTPLTLPDIDYDTDGRDAVKNYLTQKYGQDHVCLLGTFNTLKTKGAIKDICRQLRPDPEILEGLLPSEEEQLREMYKGFMTFDEVNAINKKFDLLKRTDFDSEIEFFEATLEADPELKKWFEQNKDIHDALVNILGNAKSSGVHAGGIVVSSKDIKRIVPLTYDRDENLWVTQVEYAEAEFAGLIKYDFLGLKTLGDLNRCITMVNKRHGTKYTLSNIPLDDMDSYRDFQKGETVSVFQFSTDLVSPNLPKLKSIDSIIDLAIITSIYRPGPLGAQMDQVFIKRKNGEEKIEYPHISLEKHLKDTYGVLVFQEQIMQVVMDLGGVSPSDSVVVLKAMGKKQKEKLVKFRDQFVKTAKAKYQIDETLANNIFDLIQNFAEYGFNKCLTGDTKVLKHNGESISLDSIKNLDLINDPLYLRSFDPIAKKIVDDQCLEFVNSGEQEVYEIELENGKKIKCTLEHEFLCSDMKKHKLREILELELEIIEVSDDLE